MTRAYTGDLLRDISLEGRGVNGATLAAVIVLAVEIAREGREGRKVGALFVVGDAAATLRRSKCLILDPLRGHPEECKRLANRDLRETVKELAQLDGAFLVSDDGVILSACRYINASAEGIDLPLGLGSRHAAAASITKETAAVAVVLSESAVVRVFGDGQLLAEIIPELWLLREHGLHPHDPYTVFRADGRGPGVSTARCQQAPLQGRGG
jgi:DNA integrity scanning protein DisA with diadenylate cyclase activity